MWKKPCDGTHFKRESWPTSIRLTQEKAEFFCWVSQKSKVIERSIRKVSRYWQSNEEGPAPKNKLSYGREATVMTALWKRNSLIMWKYLKEELFTAVKILKGDPAPTTNNKESASKGDRQRLKQSGSCWENYLEQRGGGGVYVSFDIKERSSILLSLGFPFWSSHLTKHYLFWMHSMHFLKEKSIKNLYKQSWLTPPPIAPFVSDEVGFRCITILFPVPRIYTVLFRY